MKYKTITMLLVSTLTLSGCILFEARTYGVRDSEWQVMSYEDRRNTKQAYEKRQREVNNLIIVQNQRRERERTLALHSHHYHDAAEEVRDDEGLRRQQELIAMRHENNRVSRLNATNLEHAQHHEAITAGQNQEQLDIAQAKRRSIETHRVEQEVRNASAAAEEAEIAQAKRRSLQTHSLEQEVRHSRAASEQADIAEATRRSLETHGQEQQARHSNNHHASSASSTVEPNEGQLVRGGEVVMSLQRRLGRTPLLGEMQSELQSSMGISPRQARQIIESLGLY